MIRYSHVGIDVRVFIDKTRVGIIKRSADGWRYFPKGSKTGGEPNHSLEAVKRSLETK